MKGFQFLFNSPSIAEHEGWVHSQKISTTGHGCVQSKYIVHCLNLGLRFILFSTLFPVLRKMLLNHICY